MKAKLGGGRSEPTMTVAHTNMIIQLVPQL